MLALPQKLTNADLLEFRTEFDKCGDGCEVLLRRAMMPIEIRLTANLKSMITIFVSGEFDVKAPMPYLAKNEYDAVNKFSKRTKSATARQVAFALFNVSERYAMLQTLKGLYSGAAQRGDAHLENCEFCTT